MSIRTVHRVDFESARSDGETFYMDASELSLPPGSWPDQLVINDHSYYRGQRVIDMDGGFSGYYYFDFQGHRLLVGND